MENEKNNYISTVLQSIVSTFNKLLASIKKHGLVISLFACIIFVSLYSFIISPVHIGSMIEESWKHHLQQEQVIKDVLIERRYEANEIIGDIMTKLVEKYDCNRVLLLEKHNSVKSLGNVDFLYLSCSFEFLDYNNENLYNISEDLQRQMTVNLIGNDILERLKHTKYLYYDDVQTLKRTNCRLLSKLKQIGEKQCIIYPFNDNKHRPLLILVICGDNLNKDEIVEYIDMNSQKINEILIFE